MKLTEELSKYRSILNEDCKFCGKPVTLIPSAAERARKSGEHPSHFKALFPNHAECEIASRSKDSIDAARQRVLRDKKSEVILKNKPVKEETTYDHQQHDDQNYTRGWNAAIDAAIMMFSEYQAYDELSPEMVVSTLHSLKTGE